MDSRTYLLTKGSEFLEIRRAVSGITVVKYSFYKRVVCHPSAPLDGVDPVVRRGRGGVGGARGGAAGGRGARGGLAAPRALAPLRAGAAAGLRAQAARHECADQPICKNFYDHIFRHQTKKYISKSCWSTPRLSEAATFTHKSSSHSNFL